MKRMVVALATLVVVAGFVGCAPEREAGRDGTAWQRDGTRQRVTTHDIVEMSKAGISDSVILAYIDASGTRFHLRARDIIALRDSSVSEYVIQAMVQNETRTRPPDERKSYAYSGVYGYDPFWYTWYPWYPWYGAYTWYWHRPAYIHRTVVPHFYSRGGFGGYRGGGVSRSRR